MKKIVLFYKKLIEPGGAERLLVKEYVNFIRFGYEVDIVAFEISRQALFDVEVKPNDLVELSGSNWIKSMILFVKYARKNKNAIYLCASGHIEIYLLSIFTGIKYSLHIHQPSFMSFTEADKYSIFLRKHFKKMLKSNYGASKFNDILSRMSFIRKLYINLRAILSVNAIKGAKNTFVLSEYAKKEKKILFNIDAMVLCGALDSSVFEYVPKSIDKYTNFKYKILSVSRLDENKRTNVLIKAFKLFLSYEPNAVLLIGGRGPEEGRLKKLVKELGIEKNVIFLGFISEKELFDWYSMADLFVSVDWADYRITMYEALVMGTKVIISNEAAPDGFLIASKYLYLTMPEPSSLAHDIIKAKSDLPTISKSELKRYLKNFTWYNYSKSIAKILVK